MCSVQMFPMTLYGFQGQQITPQPLDSCGWLPTAPNSSIWRPMTSDLNISYVWPQMASNPTTYVQLYTKYIIIASHIFVLLPKLNCCPNVIYGTGISLFQNFVFLYWTSSFALNLTDPYLWLQEPWTISKYLNSPSSEALVAMQINHI